MTAAERQKHKSGKGNINSFVFFLILATLFWVLTKFSKQYQQDIQAEVEFVNMPANTMVSDAASTIPIRVSASGFEFLYYKLSKPKLSIDLSTISPNEQARWTISKQNLENLATIQLKHPVTVLTDKSSLELPLRDLGQRRVAVQARVDYTFKEGYSYLAPLAISPDSVTVIGPENQILKVTNLLTEAASFKELDEGIEGTLKINLPKELSGVKVDPEEVTYRMEVQEFIENEVLVPITLVGNDQQQGIQLFPSSVTVRYTINFSDYKSVQPADFKVVCDLSKVEPGGKYLIPELIDFPEGARRLSISPDQIEFIAIQ
jgi:hypothetical protein